MPAAKSGPGRARTKATAPAAAILAAPPHTKAGRILESTLFELTDQIGEDATGAQRILIRMCAVKVTRALLWERRMLDPEADPSADDQVRWLAWSNSARMDLVALGLEKAAAGPAVDLTAYLERKGKQQLS